MIHTCFSKEDIQHFTAHGHTTDTVLAQIEIFKKGMPFTTLHRPCTVGDGITVLRQSDMAVLEALYAQAASAGRVTKFVPASGAATRMFQALLAVYEQKEPVDGKNHHDFLQFTEKIQQFAFYDDLQNLISKHGCTIETLIGCGQYPELLGYLLTSKDSITPICPRHSCNSTAILTTVALPSKSIWSKLQPMSRTAIRLPVCI